MKAPHVKTALLTLAALALIPMAHAQERTAAGAMETQMNWSTLNTKVTNANTKTDAVNSRVDQVAACGGKGMLYAPGQPGADSQGCVISKLDPTYVNMLTTINSNVNNINNCAAGGGVYNRNTNSCLSVAKTRWFMAGQGGACVNCENGPPTRWAESVGYPGACGGSSGVIGRLCNSPSDRCHKIEGSTECRSRGGDSSDSCSSSRWAVLYACE